MAFVVIACVNITTNDFIFKSKKKTFLRPKHLLYLTEVLLNTYQEYAKQMQGYQRCMVINVYNILGKIS